MSVTQTITLVDGISGPAAKASAAIRKLASEQSKLNKGKVSSASTGSAKKAMSDEQRVFAERMKHNAQVRKFTEKNARDQARAASKAQAPDSNLGAGAMAGLVAGGVSLAADAAVAAGRLAIQGAKFVGDIVMFKEQALRAFTLMGGSAEAGKTILNKAIKTASEINEDPREVITSFQDLLSRGFKIDTVVAITKAMDDLADVNPTAPISSITDTLAKMNSTGSVSAKQLKTVAVFGGGMEAIMADIAAATGQSMADVKKSLDKGTLSASVAVPAILAAISKQAAKGKDSDTFGELAKGIKGNLIGAIMGVDLGPLSSVRDMLKGIKAALDPGTKSAEKFQAIIGTLFSAVGKFFAALTGTDVTGTLDGPLTSLEAMAKALETAAPLAGKFTKGLLQGMADVAAAVNTVTAFIDRVQGIGKAGSGPSALGKIFQYLGKTVMLVLSVIGVGVASTMALLVGPILAVGAGVLWLIDNFGSIASSIGGALSSAWSAVSTWVSQVIGKIGSLASSAYSAGVNMIQGFINGVTSMVGGVIDAVGNIASSAASALTSPLQIQSPSKLFAGYGRDTALGFAQGMQSMTGAVGSAAGIMAGAAVAPANDNAGASSAVAAGASAGTAAVAGGAVSGGGGKTYNFQVTVNASGGKDSPEDFARKFYAEFRKLAEAS